MIETKLYTVCNSYLIFETCPLNKSKLHFLMALIKGQYKGHFYSCQKDRTKHILLQIHTTFSYGSNKRIFLFRRTVKNKFYYKFILHFLMALSKRYFYSEGQSKIYYYISILHFLIALIKGQYKGTLYSERKSKTYFITNSYYISFWF